MKTLILLIAASVLAPTVMGQLTSTGTLEVSNRRRSVLNPEDAKPTNENCSAHCSNFAVDLQGCDDDDECFCTTRVRTDFVDCSSCNAAQDPSKLSDLQDKADEYVHRCEDHHTPIDAIKLNTTISGSSGNSTNNGGNPTGSTGNSTQQPLSGGISWATPQYHSALSPWFGALGGMMWIL